MLWVDKHRPVALDKFELHADTAGQLASLAQSGECPHLLVYGPPGAGKKTLVLALLRQLFGPGADKLKVETKDWKIERPEMAAKVEVELTTVSSNYHVELTPSDAGLKDRYVVQELIKEMAKSRPLDVASFVTGGQQGGAGSSSTGEKEKQKASYKVLVLNEVDSLSREAQHSLRRTMEKYSSACRLVLVCSNVSKVMEAVRSRCLAIRVPAPSSTEIGIVLEHVANKEGLTLPHELAARVAQQADGNLRKALLSLEACKVTQYPFTADQSVQQTDWELYLQEVTADILAEQSPKCLLGIRTKLYELIINCIPPVLILKRLTMLLMQKCDAELKHEICHWAAFYEHRLQTGQKPILHLEAFVAKFMSVYKRYVINLFG